MFNAKSPLALSHEFSFFNIKFLTKLTEMKIVFHNSHWVQKRSDVACRDTTKKQNRLTNFRIATTGRSSFNEKDPETN